MEPTEHVVDLARGLFGIITAYVAKLPRDMKFTVGDRLVCKCIDILECVTSAYYGPRPERTALIDRANVYLEVIRQILRMLFETSAHSLQKHEHLNREIDELGRRLGAWKKSLVRPDRP